MHCEVSEEPEGLRLDQAVSRALLHFVSELTRSWCTLHESTSARATHAAS